MSFRKTYNSIKRVIEKRKHRGANKNEIEKYLKHLLLVWRNDEIMMNAIKQILKQEQEEI